MVEINELIIQTEKALRIANKNEEIIEKITISQYGFMYLSTLMYIFIMITN